MTSYRDIVLCLIFCMKHDDVILRYDVNIKNLNAQTMTSYRDVVSGHVFRVFEVTDNER